MSDSDKTVIMFDRHGDHRVVLEICNIFTDKFIKLRPPIELESDDAVRGFCAWMAAYCRSAWEMGLDLETVDASDWRNGQPVSH